MNRIDRLFAILLLLQTQKRLQAQEVARHFAISERTVYRDMAALMEMGIPILSQPGEGYQLGEFYLPPVVLTTPEASALYLGLKMLAASGNLPTQAEQGLRKILAILPQRTRQQVQAQADLIDFVMPSNRFTLNSPHLLTLQQAIKERWVVDLTYSRYPDGQMTQRQVEPLQLLYSAGAWYFTAFCRLRQATRSFRLERVERLHLLPDSFQRPADDSPALAPELEVTVCFSPQVIRWVRERQHYAAIEEVQDSDGRWRITYQVHDWNELLHWLLGWGTAAEVLQPLELRQKLRQEAQALADLLT